MFPHDRLKTRIERLQRATSADTDVQLDLCRVLLSDVLFHNGRPEQIQQALALSKRILYRTPAQSDARVIAALCLVLLERSDDAKAYLQVSAPTHADDPWFVFAHALALEQLGHHDQALEAWQRLVTLQPQSWEAHARYGLALAPQDGDAHLPVRTLEAAQFHIVTALQNGATTAITAQLRFTLARLSRLLGRHAEAERIFLQLTKSPGPFHQQAYYELGLVCAATGRPSKAIHYFQHFAAHSREHAGDTWTRIAACHLALGEPQKAREACAHTLESDPSNVEARWTLGQAQLMAGQPHEARQSFLAILKDFPDHHASFKAIVTSRVQTGNYEWLRKALHQEVRSYDRQPIQVTSHDPVTQTVRRSEPRKASQERIEEVIAGLKGIDPEATRTVLRAISLTTDEGLRFHLWEHTLNLLAAQRAHQIRSELAQAHTHFGRAEGLDVLTLANLLEDRQLIDAMAIQETDLRRAAMTRHPPTGDLQTYRDRITLERSNARAWQAFLLLAIASHHTPTSRNLLARWASDADGDLALAARAGLALAGDRQALDALAHIAQTHHIPAIDPHAHALTSESSSETTLRIVSDRDDLICASCGRRGSEVGHMVLARGVAVCNQCLTQIHENRDRLRTDDAHLRCALTGVSLPQAETVYLFNRVPVSAEVVNLSIGHDEREIVSRFFARTWPTA